MIKERSLVFDLERGNNFISTSLLSYLDISYKYTTVKIDF